MQSDKMLEQVLTDFLLLGAVHLHAKWRIYALTLGEWTLDYPAYDPDWEPISEKERRSFRNGLFRVDEKNADEFCGSVRAYEVPLDILRLWIEMYNVQLTMLVDFDARRFVHGYSEPVEPKSNYIPAGWAGIVGEPLDYVSEAIRQLWLFSGV